jgi:hypothetical protein
MSEQRERISVQAGPAFLAAAGRSMRRLGREAVAP